MKRSKPNKEKIKKNVYFEEKKSIRKYNGVKPSTQRDKKVKQTPGAIWNKGIGDFRT